MTQNLGGDGVDYSSRFITTEYFPTIDDAIKWAQKVALDIGFGFIISSWTNADRKLLRAKRKNTRTKSCGCKFQILAAKVITNHEDVSYTIVPQPGIKGTHNHSLIVYPEGHCQLTKLTREAKLLVRELSSSQVKPSAIEAAIHSKFPDQHVTRKQIYNYRSKIRKTDFEARDVVGQFYHLHVNGSWKKVMHAATEEQYEDEIKSMKDRWSHQPQVLSYLENTWLKYKIMFIPAWTNRVLHCGNTTNCRVESAHAQLKNWLNSSTGALDTIWVKINKEIEAQVISMRYSLEQSMNRRCLAFIKFPLNYLGCFVSDYCLMILAAELKRMRSLGKEVFERCGCVLQTTHQIPCACQLHSARESKTPISINQIHEFWRTLVIGSHVAEPNNNFEPDYGFESC